MTVTRSCRLRVPASHQALPRNGTSLVTPTSATWLCKVGAVLKSAACHQPTWDQATSFEFPHARRNGSKIPDEKILSFIASVHLLSGPSAKLGETTSRIRSRAVALADEGGLAFVH